MDTELVNACYLEAQRADLVASRIDQLRAAIPQEFHDMMRFLAREIRTTSARLFDLADRIRVQLLAAPVMVDYLLVVLPSLSMTLRDMTRVYEDKTLSREIRWRKMYNDMTEESGLPVEQRFMIYSQFLTCLKHMVNRSPTYLDLSQLDRLRDRIIMLRRERQMLPPTLQVVAPAGQGLMLKPATPEHVGVPSSSHAHWAQRIRNVPLSSRTALKDEHKKPSKLYGRPLFWEQIDWEHLDFRSDPMFLLRWPFKNNQLCVVVILNPVNLASHLIIRVIGSDGKPWFCHRGLHELVITREGAALQLCRYSFRESQSKLWATLGFQTWEDMVLFHCIFVALKAQSPQTRLLSSKEYVIGCEEGPLSHLGHEKRLFQAKIFDDDFTHSLIVYEDSTTGGMRLHAAVWEGELVKSPVWTAFVTKKSESENWLRRRKKRVWLNDVELHVFCQHYKHHHMRRNKTGAFELHFNSEEAAVWFEELFSSSPESPEESEENETIAGPSK